MKIHPSFKPWAARLAGGAGEGTRMFAAAPTTPSLDSSQPTSWFMGNVCMKQKCPLASHVKWTVRCWQEAAWKFSSWLGRCDGLCDDGSTQEPPTPTPFPEIPLSGYGRMPTWTLLPSHFTGEGNDGWQSFIVRTMP